MICDKVGQQTYFVYLHCHNAVALIQKIVIVFRRGWFTVLYDLVCAVVYQSHKQQDTSSCSRRCFVVQAENFQFYEHSV